METFEEIKVFLDNHQKLKSSLTCLTVNLTAGTSVGGDYYEIADSYSKKLGFKPLYKQWKVLEKDHAVRLLSKMLHRSLAYHIEMMPLKTATHVAETFIGLFDRWGATYLSNGDIQEGSAYWAEITASTMEMALVVFDSEKIGIVCVEDED